MCVFVFGICIIAQPCEKVVEWRKLREVKRSARKEILNLVANHGTIEMPCKLKEQKVVVCERNANTHFLSFLHLPIIRSFVSLMFLLSLIVKGKNSNVLRVCTKSVSTKPWSLM
mmetsp:Transcript_48067/g.124881  ORF Transcript_48067/g.124881 Transcript_48067/m.124881 type:complete len:114 (+) Transcript_48067:121-462(+)